MSAAVAERAAALDAAVAELAAIEARGRAAPPADEADALRYIAAIGACRRLVRALRPHTLLWRATLPDGTGVAVETRDKSDFVSDTSDETFIVGAFAEVPWRDPMRPKYRETEGSHYDTAWHDEAAREADHRAAVARLCEDNGWDGATIERAGERWDP